MAVPAGRTSQRWALSFADLCLLLLGFFVLLQAHGADRPRMAESIRAAFGRPAADTPRFAAADLFEPGEAILRPEGRRRLAPYAGRPLTLESRGLEPGTSRLDGWELAAARAASAARLLAAGDERRVNLVLADTRPGPQRLTLVLR